MSRELTEEERIDSVRYALRDAIRVHLDRCGSVVAIDGIPDETVASAFLTILGERGFIVTQEPPPMPRCTCGADVVTAGMFVPPTHREGCELSRASLAGGAFALGGEKDPRP